MTAGVTKQSGQAPSSFDKLLADSGNLDFATIARTLPALGFKFLLVAADAKLVAKRAEARAGCGEISCVTGEDAKPGDRLMGMTML